MCIFCQIIEGNIPSYKVYEDDKYLAILDISQTTYGHSLVMPKKHYDNILETPIDEVKEMMEVALNVSKKLVEKLDAKGLNILNNTNEVSGQSVMHTHIHLIPRYGKEDTLNISFKENKYDLKEVLAKIND